MNNPAAHFLTTAPEIWKQTEGKVTHFVATTGTCGTLTGCSRYFKSIGADVKVVGVTPIVGHDIPGVRSRAQLELTNHFHESEYDCVVDCNNQEAYEATALINKKESLQGGPTSGLGLAGAVKAVPDEEGNVIVLIFCDSVFKYTDNVRKHLPHLFPKAGPQADPKASRLYKTMQKLYMNPSNPDVLDHTNVGEFYKKQNGNVVVVDVRPDDEFKDWCRAPNAVHIPLKELERAFEENDQAILSKLPADKSTPLLSVCNRGIASATGLIVLKGLGYPAKNLWGGMFSWVHNELPIEGNAYIGITKNDFERDVEKNADLEKLLQK